MKLFGIKGALLSGAIALCAFGPAVAQFGPGAGYVPNAAPLPSSGGTLTGNVVFSPDNTYDIGASGATRPRNIYAANNVLATNGFFMPGKSGFQSSVDGNLTAYNFASTGFGLLQFGGTTSSFPALKRTAAGLEVKLADDSGYALLSVEELVTNPRSVGSLPTCNAGQQGGRKFVTDGTVAASGNFGAAVVGGGANAVPVYCDGTSWKIG